MAITATETNGQIGTDHQQQTDGNASFLRAARAGNLEKVLEYLKGSIDINTSNANGLNALHLAAKEGHVNVVSELLKRGANVNAATKKGNTALHIASLAGQEEVVKLLVQKQANVNVQSQNGFTPLYMAAQENHDTVVRFLLSNGANQSLATEDGFTPLAVALQQGHDKVVAVLLENDARGKVRLPALHIASKKDDCKAAALLLHSEHNPDVTSKSGFTPLHIAAHYGNSNIATLLLEKGADVNFPAKHQITPLHVAAKWGKANMVKLLLDKGAKMDASTRDGLTPLHCAARSGHDQVVEQLLEKNAPITAKTKNGLAPLHMASQGDHVDSARILLYHKAPVDDVTVDYLTALHVAAHCGHVGVAKLLLDRKADPNSRALNGFTPLHIACKKNRIKVVELLLKHGASIEATTESGLTPLHVASFMGCMNIVIYLIQHGANPDIPTVRGETPLHLAARANQTDIIRILLRNGAHVDAKARELQTALHIASRLGNADMVGLLLQHGAAVDAPTKDAYTPLHVAAREGQDEVAALLLDHGAALSAPTKKGFTPLHLAAKYGNIKVAKLLLQKDAPVDAQGKNGVTPLHVAAHYDHVNVALLLLEKGASPHAAARNGYTPLHVAARKDQMDIASSLLEYGARPGAESRAGFTPLHLAAQEGHADLAALLVEHGADCDAKAKNGLTPLHLCAQEDRVNVAAILAKSGATIDPTTKAGYTPLHVACHFGQTNMIRFLLRQGADVNATTSHGYTPLHQAAQQGHTLIINLLLEHRASPNATTKQGQTALSIAQRLGYISVVETLKVVTETIVTTTTTTVTEEKYKVVAPETMHETFMSDSEDEGAEDNMLGDQSFRYLTASEMKSLGDDSLPIDVTRDERISESIHVGRDAGQMAPLTQEEERFSPTLAHQTEAVFSGNYAPDNVDISRTPIHAGFLVSFLVDARGGAMRGCRHSGVRVIIPPRKAQMPMRITCRYLRKEKLPHPPPLLEGESCASRILEVGPAGAKFLGPVILEVPHFASLRGKEREITILRSDNGETWKEHTLEASEEAVQEVLNESFEGEELSALEDLQTNRITRILTTDFPQYFAVVSRTRQEVHAVGPEGGMLSSTVVPQVQAIFPEGALTKKIRVGLQAQPIPPELVTKLLGHRVAVSPIVTVEPRRRKFHKPITLTIPVPQAATKGMINQYAGDAPTLRLLCSITGGVNKAQWEDVTGSTPLTFVNDCVSFTTTVSARFWLMDCRQVSEATKFATELYAEAIHVPFMAKFVVFAKRRDPTEAQLRVFCMTDDKEDKTLETQEHFAEVAKSRDVEVLENKSQYLEFAGNLVPVTKSGEQLRLHFQAFRENRVPFEVRVKDVHQEPLGRVAFMREPRAARTEPPQVPLCNLNIALPEFEASRAVSELVTLEKKYGFVEETGLAKPELIHRADLRLSDIARELGADWVPLASQLDVPEQDVSSIRTECPSDLAQQALLMLRLWMKRANTKATGNNLEKGLRRINREDIVNKCMFNVELVTDDVEKAVAKVHLDQSGFDTFREELGGTPKSSSLKRDGSLDVSYDEQDLMKAESAEETSSETGSVHEKHASSEAKGPAGVRKGSPISAVLGRLVRGSSKEKTAPRMAIEENFDEEPTSLRREQQPDVTKQADTDDSPVAAPRGSKKKGKKEKSPPITTAIKTFIMERQGSKSPDRRSSGSPQPVSPEKDLKPEEVFDSTPADKHKKEKTPEVKTGIKALSISPPKTVKMSLETSALKEPGKNGVPGSKPDKGARADERSPVGTLPDVVRMEVKETPVIEAVEAPKHKTGTTETDGGFFSKFTKKKSKDPDGDADHGAAKHKPLPGILKDAKDMPAGIVEIVQVTKHEVEKVPEAEVFPKSGEPIPDQVFPQGPQTGKGGPTTVVKRDVRETPGGLMEVVEVTTHNVVKREPDDDGLPTSDARHPEGITSTGLPEEDPPTVVEREVQETPGGLVEVVRVTKHKVGKLFDSVRPHKVDKKLQEGTVPSGADDKADDGVKRVFDGDAHPKSATKHPEGMTLSGSPEDDPSTVEREVQETPGGLVEVVRVTKHKVGKLFDSVRPHKGDKKLQEGMVPCEADDKPSTIVRREVKDTPGGQIEVVQVTKHEVGRHPESDEHFSSIPWEADSRASQEMPPDVVKREVKEIPGGHVEVVQVIKHKVGKAPDGDTFLEPDETISQRIETKIVEGRPTTVRKEVTFMPDALRDDVPRQDHGAEEDDPSTIFAKMGDLAKGRHTDPSTVVRTETKEFPDKVVKVVSVTKHTSVAPGAEASFGDMTADLVQSLADESRDSPTTPGSVVFGSSQDFPDAIDGRPAGATRTTVIKKEVLGPDGVIQTTTSVVTSAAPQLKSDLSADLLDKMFGEPDRSKPDSRLKDILSPEGGHKVAGTITPEEEELMKQLFPEQESTGVALYPPTGRVPEAAIIPEYRSWSTASGPSPQDPEHKERLLQTLGRALSQDDLDASSPTEILAAVTPAEVDTRDQVEEPPIERLELARRESGPKTVEFSPVPDEPLTKAMAFRTKPSEDTIVTSTKVKDVLDDGVVKHTVTTVTKTTIVQEVDEPPAHQDAGATKPVESDTWASDLDTSQVSVSSLPEDEKTEPTATLSSSATTTTAEPDDTAKEPLLQTQVEEKEWTETDPDSGGVRHVIRKTTHTTMTSVKPSESAHGGDTKSTTVSRVMTEELRNVRPAPSDEEDPLTFVQKKEFFEKLSEQSPPKDSSRGRLGSSPSLDTTLTRPVATLKPRPRSESLTSQGEIIEESIVFSERLRLFQEKGERSSLPESQEVFPVLDQVDRVVQKVQEELDQDVNIPGIAGVVMPESHESIPRLGKFQEELPGSLAGATGQRNLPRGGEPSSSDVRGDVSGFSDRLDGREASRLLVRTSEPGKEAFDMRSTEIMQGVQEQQFARVRVRSPDGELDESLPRSMPDQVDFVLHDAFRESPRPSQQGRDYVGKPTERSGTLSDASACLEHETAPSVRALPESFVPNHTNRSSEETFRSEDSGVAPEGLFTASQSHILASGLQMGLVAGSDVLQRGIEASPRSGILDALGTSPLGTASTEPTSLSQAMLSPSEEPLTNHLGEGALKQPHPGKLAGQGIAVAAAPIRSMPLSDILSGKQVEMMDITEVSGASSLLEGCIELSRRETSVEDYPNEKTILKTDYTEIQDKLLSAFGESTTARGNDKKSIEGVSREVLEAFDASVREYSGPGAEGTKEEVLAFQPVCVPLQGSISPPTEEMSEESLATRHISAEQTSSGNGLKEMMADELEQILETLIDTQTQATHPAVSETALGSKSTTIRHTVSSTLTAVLDSQSSVTSDILTDTEGSVIQTTEKLQSPAHEKQVETLISKQHEDGGKLEDIQEPSVPAYSSAMLKKAFEETGPNLLHREEKEPSKKLSFADQQYEKSDQNSDESRGDAGAPEQDLLFHHDMDSGGRAHSAMADKALHHHFDPKVLADKPEPMISSVHVKLSQMATEDRHLRFDREDEGPKGTDVLVKGATALISRSATEVSSELSKCEQQIRGLANAGSIHSISKGIVGKKLEGATPEPSADVPGAIDYAVKDIGSKVVEIVRPRDKVAFDMPDYSDEDQQSDLANYKEIELAIPFLRGGSSSLEDEVEEAGSFSSGDMQAEKIAEFLTIDTDTDRPVQFPQVFQDGGAPFDDNLSAKSEAALETAPVQGKRVGFLMEDDTDERDERAPTNDSSLLTANRQEEIEQAGRIVDSVMQMASSLVESFRGSGDVAATDVLRSTTASLAFDSARDKQDMEERWDVPDVDPDHKHAGLFGSPPGTSEVSETLSKVGPDPTSQEQVEVVGMKEIYEALKDTRDHEERAQYTIKNVGLDLGEPLQAGGDDEEDLEARRRGSPTAESLDDQAQIEKCSREVMMQLLDGFSQSDMELAEVRTEDEAPDIEDDVPSPDGGSAEEKSAPSSHEGGTREQRTAASGDDSGDFQPQSSMEVEIGSQTSGAPAAMSELEFELCPDDEAAPTGGSGEQEAGSWSAQAGLDQSAISNAPEEQAIQDRKMPSFEPESDQVAMAVHAAAAAPAAAILASSHAVGGREELRSPLLEASPPEETAYVMEQDISPAQEYPEYLTPDMQVSVGTSPTEMLPMQQKASVEDVFESSIQECTAIHHTTGTVHYSESSVESSSEVEMAGAPTSGTSVMAFENVAFAGEDVIDASSSPVEESSSPAGSRSPYEVVREGSTAVEEEEAAVKAAEAALHTEEQIVRPQTLMKSSSDQGLSVPETLTSIKTLVEHHIETHLFSEEPDEFSHGYPPERAEFCKEMLGVSLLNVGDGGARTPESRRGDSDEDEEEWADHVLSKIQGRPDPPTPPASPRAVQSAVQVKEQVTWEAPVVEHEQVSVEMVDEIPTKKQMIVEHDESSTKEDGSHEQGPAPLEAGQLPSVIRKRPLLEHIPSEISDEDLVEREQSPTSHITPTCRGDRRDSLSDSSPDSDGPKATSTHRRSASGVAAIVLETGEQQEPTESQTGDVKNGKKADDKLGMDTTSEDTSSMTVIEEEVSVRSTIDPYRDMVSPEREGTRSTSLKLSSGSGSSPQERSDGDSTGNGKVDISPPVVLRSKSKTSIKSDDKRSSRDFDTGHSGSETDQSHYYSFEMTSDSGKTPGASRPTSSEFDINVLSGQASSEYETCVNSQDGEVSGSYATAATSSQEASFATARSSLSGSLRGSAYSVDSESSGHLGSLEASSEASETIVASAHEDLDSDSESQRSSSALREPYDGDIPESVIRSGVEVPFFPSWQSAQKESSILEPRHLVHQRDHVAPGSSSRSFHSETCDPLPECMSDLPRLLHGYEHNHEDADRTNTSPFLLTDNDQISSKTDEVDGAAAVSEAQRRLQPPDDHMTSSHEEEQLSVSESSATQSEHTWQTSVETVVDAVQMQHFSCDSDHYQRQSTMLDSVPLPFDEPTMVGDMYDPEVQGAVGGSTTPPFREINGPVEVDYMPEYDDLIAQTPRASHQQDLAQEQLVLAFGEELEGGVVSHGQSEDQGLQHQEDGTEDCEGFYTEMFQGDLSTEEVEGAASHNLTGVCTHIFGKGSTSEQSSAVKEPFERPASPEPADEIEIHDDESCLLESEQLRSPHFSSSFIKVHVGHGITSASSRDGLNQKTSSSLETPCSDEATSDSFKFVDKAGMRAAPEDEPFDLIPSVSEVSEITLGREEVSPSEESATGTAYAGKCENYLIQMQQAYKLGMVETVHDDRSFLQEEAMDVENAKLLESKLQEGSGQRDFPYDLSYQQEYPGDGRTEYSELYTHQEVEEEGYDEERIRSRGGKSPISDERGSTPDYDTLAGRKTFGKGSEKDDASTSSLMEFERLEAEMGGKSSSVGSSDSFSGRQVHGGRNGGSEPDSVSVNSLTEFEKLEKELVEAEGVDAHLRGEPVPRLDEIDEGHESQASDPGQETSVYEIESIVGIETSCIPSSLHKLIADSEAPAPDRHSGTATETFPNSVDDVRRPPLDLDLESVRVERHFLTTRTESGHSVDSVDRQSSASTTTQFDADSLREREIDDSDLNIPSDTLGWTDDRDSLYDSERHDSLQEYPSEEKDSLQERDPSAEMDSLQDDRNDLQDSLHETRDIEWDSFHADELPRDGHRQSSTIRTTELSPTMSRPAISPLIAPVVIERIDTLTWVDHEPSDMGLIAQERSDALVSSTDSLEPSSSADTNATYKFETDSMMSSLTSAEEATMVSSADSLDHEKFRLTSQGQMLPLESCFASRDEGVDQPFCYKDTSGLFFDQDVPTVCRPIRQVEGSALPQDDNIEERFREYLLRSAVTPTDEEQVEERQTVDEKGNLIVTRTVKRHLTSEPQLHTQTFSGPDAEQRSREFVASFSAMQPSADKDEYEGFDESGNSVRVTQRVLVKPSVKTVTFTGPNARAQMQEYMRNLGVAQHSSAENTPTSDSGVGACSSLASPPPLAPDPPAAAPSSACPGLQRLSGGDHWMEQELAPDGSAEPVISSRVITTQTTRTIGPDGQEQVITTTSSSGDQDRELRIRRSMQGVLDSFMADSGQPVPQQQQPSSGSYLDDHEE